MKPKPKRNIENLKDEKPKSKTVEFIEVNTNNNITMKRDFLYLEDVKIAININHLEVSVNLKRWLLNQLKSSVERKRIIEVLEESAEMDRHRLQKGYKISIQFDEINWGRKMDESSIAICLISSYLFFENRMNKITILAA